MIQKQKKKQGMKDENGFIKLQGKDDKLYLPDLLSCSSGVFGKMGLEILWEGKGFIHLWQGKTFIIKSTEEKIIIEEVIKIFEVKFKNGMADVEKWINNKGESKQELYKYFKINSIKRALKILEVMKQRGTF